jgi:hypothetical protein
LVIGLVWSQFRADWKRENYMKKLLAIIALTIVTGAQALAPAANAARTHRNHSTGQGEACTYDGYPCSQWEHMRDRW